MLLQAGQILQGCDMERHVVAAVVSLLCLGQRDPCFLHPRHRGVESRLALLLRLFLFREKLELCCQRIAPGRDRRLLLLERIGPVSQFLDERFGRIPHVGERLDWAGWRFEVVDLDGARIDKLLLHRLPDADDEDLVA